MPCALIVAHGQPSDPAPPKATLACLARQVQKCLPGWQIRSATLASPGRLETTLAGLPENVRVYPFFMSGGWFVREALPDRLASAGPVTLVSPFGLDPQLPELAVRMIRYAMMRHDLSAKTPRILLSAHGAVRGPHPARAAREFGRKLEYLLPGIKVNTGFVQQKPYLRDVVARLDGPAISLPLFALNGDHYRHDVLPVLDKAGFVGPRLPVLGSHPHVAGLIARSLENATTQRAVA